MEPCDIFPAYACRLCCTDVLLMWHPMPPTLRPALQAVVEQQGRQLCKQVTAELTGADWGHEGLALVGQGLLPHMLQQGHLLHHSLQQSQLILCGKSCPGGLVDACSGLVDMGVKCYARIRMGLRMKVCVTMGMQGDHSATLSLCCTAQACSVALWSPCIPIVTAVCSLLHILSCASPCVCVHSTRGSAQREVKAAPCQNERDPFDLMFEQQ